MEQYTVTGMSCAACSARVEKAVSKLPGVESCSVSLLTNSMGVEGTVSPQEVIHAVQEAGYGERREYAEAGQPVRQEDMPGQELTLELAGELVLPERNFWRTMKLRC